MDSSLSGSCIHRIFQARVLGWVAISFFHRLDPVNLYTILGGLRKHYTAIQRWRLLWSLILPNYEPRMSPEARFLQASLWASLPT